MPWRVTAPPTLCRARELFVPPQDGPDLCFPERGHGQRARRAATPHRTATARARHVVGSSVRPLRSTATTRPSTEAPPTGSSRLTDASPRVTNTSAPPGCSSALATRCTRTPCPQRQRTISPRLMASGRTGTTVIASPSRMVGRMLPPFARKRTRWPRPRRSETTSRNVLSPGSKWEAGAVGVAGLMRTRTSPGADPQSQNPGRNPAGGREPWPPPRRRIRA